jgi:rRNA maturation endonuclease Nob1
VGGWNNLGRKTVKDLAKRVDAARKEPHVKKLEEDCLQRVQADLGITLDEEKNAGKKKRKRKNLPPEEESDDKFDKL